MQNCKQNSRHFAHPRPYSTHAPRRAPAVRGKVQKDGRAHGAARILPPHQFIREARALGGTGGPPVVSGPPRIAGLISYHLRSPKHSRSEPGACHALCDYAEGVSSFSPWLNRDSGATMGNGCEHQPRRRLNPVALSLVQSSIRYRGWAVRGDQKPIAPCASEP